MILCHKHNQQTPCRIRCDHDRHQSYLHLFKSSDMYERQYLWEIGKLVMDPNLSPSDADDLEIFQDLVFDSERGRLHIFFYEELFKNYYQYQPDWTLKVFVRYLVYLDTISSLFSNDAFHYIFKKEDVKLTTNLLKEMPFEIKMRFIKASEKYPNIIQMVPKLKLYNLFS